MAKKLLFFIVTLFTFNSYAATITAAGETGIVLKNWGQPSTWLGGVIPTALDDVIIPASAEISIDISTINVNSITVIGALSVPNSLATLNITTRYMMIMGSSASFTWGTAVAPWLGIGNFTLTGQTITDRIPNHSDHFSKGIVVMSGGKLDIHGQPRTSWTKLAATVNGGSNQITLATDVTGWSVGDSIVIAPTGYVRTQTEKSRIQTISGRVITLTSNLTWRHFGGILSYANNTKTFDQRAEVGLISRNITIQGSIGTGISTGYGGYIMSMVGSESRIQDINLFNMGQNGNLGSYPMHWHLVGATSNQYIKNCSIRNSFNRGVVIHGTDNLTVENNVLYQHRGHGFMLEDGDEENNTFNNNLGLNSLPPRTGLALENSEMAVATFWITNPNNTFTNNAAVASDNAGFWLIPVTSVLRVGNAKTLANTSYSPRKLKLKNFSDNTAHGCRQQNITLEGDMSLNSEQSLPPRTALFKAQYPVLDVDNDTLKYTFTRCVSYKGTNNGVWTRVSVPQIFDDCKFGDASFMAFLSFNAIVKNSLFAGITANIGSGTAADKPLGDKLLGLQMYNGSTDIYDSHMAGFGDPNKTSCIGNRQSSGKFPNFTAKNITFESDIPLSNRVNFSWESEVEDPARSYFFVAGMIDRDGSIIQGQQIDGATATAAEYANWRITPKIYRTNMSAAYDNRIYDFKFNLPSNAADYKYIENWSAYITRPTFKYAMLHNWAAWPTTQTGEEHRAIYALRSDGPATFDELRTGTDSQFPIILGSGSTAIKYFSQFHETPNRIRSEFKWTTQGASTIAAFMNVPSNLTIDKNGAALTPSNTLAALESKTTTGYFLKDNTLYVKYFATNEDLGINTSAATIDYSEADININNNPSSNDAKGLTNFVTLADYTTGVDARGVLAKPANQNIAFSTISNSSGANTFTITKGTSTANFVDYNFTLVNKQIWKEFNEITINYQGPQAVLMIRENTSAAWVPIRTLPYSATLTTYDIPLTDEAVKALNGVEQLKLRFLESAMLDSQSPYTVRLDRMTLSLDPATVNTNLLLPVNNNPLPVSLTSFTGKKVATGVQLNWTTASERNNERFDILRSSNNHLFETLTSVAGKGTTNNVNSYNYLDINPSPGVNYYQLKQIDFDGTTSLSDIVAVKSDLTGSIFNLFNTQNNLTVTFDASDKNITKIRLVDLTGRTLINSTLDAQTGLNNKTLDISKLTPGVYIVIIEAEGKTRSKKFIKQSSY